VYTQILHLRKLQGFTGLPQRLEVFVPLQWLPCQCENYKYSDASHDHIRVVKPPLIATVCGQQLQVQNSKKTKTKKTKK